MKLPVRFMLTSFVAFLLISFSAIAQDSSWTIETKSGLIRMEKFATLNEPWGMCFLPDGRMLITEKPGTLRIYDNGKLSEPVSGLPKIEYYKQGGLLDVEADPNFAQNSLIYIYYSEKAETQPNITKDPGDPRFGNFNDTTDVTLKGGAVARARLQGNTLTDVKVIWRQYPKTIGRGHFGGKLTFAADGKLFITSGDRQRFEPAQVLTGNLGKIIRINADGSIPADNPYAKNKSARPDIWSIGHRNPLGAAINPTTKQLWIHEMGPAHGDELNIPAAGKNYGWPLVSNGNNYDGSKIPDHETAPRFAAPTFYWHPAISPSGFIFYNGNLFKDWNGNALIGSFNSEALVKLKIKDNKVTQEERIWVGRRVRDIVEAPDGSIWFVTDYKEGGLYRLSPAK